MNLFTKKIKGCVNLLLFVYRAIPFLHDKKECNLGNSVYFSINYFSIFFNICEWIIFSFYVQNKI